MTVDLEAMAVGDFFKESLKAARYGNYETIINDGNGYSQLWKQRYAQLQTLNSILSAWLTSVLPFMNSLPPELLPCLENFFDGLTSFSNDESKCRSSVVCGYYACECMILLAQGPIGKIRELGERLLIPLARRLTELTWQAVIEEQKHHFSFSNISIINHTNAINSNVIIAQDALLLLENAKQVGENVKLTLEELFTSTTTPK